MSRWDFNHQSGWNEKVVWLGGSHVVRITAIGWLRVVGASLFPGSYCCWTLFTVYPEITCWPEMKPHHINWFINSVSCAISLGTWLPFKTGRSAVTLFPAKRNITLVSNVPWGWVVLSAIWCCQSAWLKWHCYVPWTSQTLHFNG